MNSAATAMVIWLIGALFTLGCMNPDIGDNDVPIDEIVNTVISWPIKLGQIAGGKQNDN